jgi:hypothetical protein
LAPAAALASVKELKLYIPRDPAGRVSKLVFGFRPWVHLLTRKEVEDENDDEDENDWEAEDGN